MITTIGKILGGGMPVGAYGGRADIMNKLAPLGSVYQAGTLSGNPLAMAAGLASLNLVDSDEIYIKLENIMINFGSILNDTSKKIIIYMENVSEMPLYFHGMIFLFQQFWDIYLYR